MGLIVVPGRRSVGLVSDCIGMIVGTCRDHCPRLSLELEDIV